MVFLDVRGNILGNLKKIKTESFCSLFFLREINILLYEVYNLGGLK